MNDNNISFAEAFGYAHLTAANARDYLRLAQYASDSTSLTSASPSTQELVTRDLRLIRQYAARDPFRSLSTEARFNHAYKIAAAAYATLGFKVPNLPLRIQEELPDPYSAQDLWGLTLDNQDARDLGVDAGIYVRPSKGYPGLGEATVCHELVHTLFSFVESEALVRGYEEGVCDLISYVALTELYGWSAACNLLTGLRLFVEDPLDMIYRDSLRQVSAHLILLGPPRWLEFLKTVQIRGRQIFIDIERELLNSSEGLSLAYGGPFPENVTDQFQLARLAMKLLGTPQSYTMSAESYLIGEAAEVGVSLTSLNEQMKPFMGSTQFHRAIGQLQSDLFLLVADGDTIIANEAPRYIRAGVCKYTMD